MRLGIVRGGGFAGIVAATALVVWAVPASAAPGDGSAYAANVAVTLLGKPGTSVGPLARTSTPLGGGTDDAAVAKLDVPGVATAGALTSKSTLDMGTGNVRAEAKIVDASVVLAGLRAEAVTATCEATQQGVAGAAELVGLVLPGGDQVPVKPDANTTIDLGVAKVVLNEHIANADGSTTINAVHITFNAVVAAGDVVLSSASCGPAAPPIPLASGSGLWLGLGVTGLAVGAASALVLRRRRVAQVVAAS
jgi:hypothetical protein